MAHQSMVGKHSLDPTGVSQHEVPRLRECEVVRDQVFALNVIGSHGRKGDIYSLSE